MCERAHSLNDDAKSHTGLLCTLTTTVATCSVSFLYGRRNARRCQACQACGQPSRPRAPVQLADAPARLGLVFLSAHHLPRADKLRRGSKAQHQSGAASVWAFSSSLRQVSGGNAGLRTLTLQRQIERPQRHSGTLHCPHVRPPIASVVATQRPDGRPCLRCAHARRARCTGDSCAGASNHCCARVPAGNDTCLKCEQVL